MNEQSTTATAALNELLRIMACLRHPSLGCPWDLQQSFATIAPHTLEETYEVLDCIERGDLQHLPEELGDLLFQVVFYARLGEEAGLFDFNAIAQLISGKLLRRHPHVFPRATLDSFGAEPTLDANGVSQQWEAIKADERRAAQDDHSILADVPLALGALLRAAKLQKRASRHGLDWPDAAQVMHKLDEELSELKAALARGAQAEIAEEFGDLLFSVVNLGRHLHCEAESALRAANRKFERRVRAVEALCAAAGKNMRDCGAAELDEWWRQVKREQEQ
ncbi:MAG: nucleoside triphosphate pyrophosphohydrolase [Pseudomonadales bacterium]|jgi:ATP diphosphatase|nr:nucleoside triphosphate pyrophosphohydrolase [Pseudomonadales bacterium]